MNYLKKMLSSGCSYVVLRGVMNERVMFSNNFPRSLMWRCFAQMWQCPRGACLLVRTPTISDAEEDLLEWMRAQEILYNKARKDYKETKKRTLVWQGRNPWATPPSNYSPGTKTCDPDTICGSRQSREPDPTAAPQQLVTLHHIKFLLHRTAVNCTANGKVWKGYYIILQYFA